MTQNWGTRRGLPHGRGTRLVVTYNLQDLSGVQYFLIYCVYRLGRTTEMRLDHSPNICKLVADNFHTSIEWVTDIFDRSGMVFSSSMSRHLKKMCNLSPTIRWSLRCLILSNLLCIPVWGRTTEMRLDHSPNIWQWASTRTRQLNSTWIEVLVKSKAYSRWDHSKLISTEMERQLGI